MPPWSPQGRAGKTARVPVLLKAEESNTQVGVSEDVLRSGAKGNRPGSSGPWDALREAERGPVAQDREVWKVIWKAGEGFQLLGEWWRDSERGEGVRRRVGAVRSVQWKARARAPGTLGEEWLRTISKCCRSKQDCLGEERKKARSGTF